MFLGAAQTVDCFYCFFCMTSLGDRNNNKLPGGGDSRTLLQVGCKGKWEQTNQQISTSLL